MAAAGVTYRQLDYWLKHGVEVGTPAQGSGSRRRFTADDVSIVRLLGEIEPLIGYGGTTRRGVGKVDILARVAAQTAADRTILERPVVYIATDGTVSTGPVSGWCLVRTPEPLAVAS